jgi:signal peptidase I
MSADQETDIGKTKTNDENIEESRTIENREESAVEDVKESVKDDLEVKDEESSQKDKKKGSFLKELLIWICIFIILFKVVPAYIIEKTVVDGISMQNTLQDKEQLMVEKVSYRFSNPKRFDIVILMPFGKDVDELYVKRVIGLPGETIQIKDEKIYINGKVLDEDYGKEPILDGGIAKEPITLGKDEYFVMGDNRNESGDSREEYIGPIKRNLIIGKAIIRIWPLNKVSFID